MVEQKITINLHPTLLKQITMVVDNLQWGYESKDDFFSEAARMLLRDIAESLKK